jgi:pilus assembly protein CpaD
MMLISLKSTSPEPAASCGLRVALLAFVALSLAGCTDRLATNSTLPDDYRARHPIVLRERPVTLNLFPGARLDEGSRRRIKEFAADLRAEGAGSVEILVPAGALNEAQARLAVPAIRAALVAEGGSFSISVGSWPVADRRATAPLRLSFRGVQARVANRCGQWPQDLASGSSLETWENRPYWNHGCAYQNMIATQLDDPRDLEAPRASSPGDIQMRSRAITKVREGADPSTGWSDKSVGIGQVGGAK